MNITIKKMKTTLLPLVVFVYVLFTLNSFYPSDNFLSKYYPDFNEDNLHKHLFEIANEPHYIGSKGHAKVRNYITGELESYGLKVHIQTGVSVSNSSIVSIPQNIVAKIPGSKTGNKALLVMSHYDSAVHSSFGAADAGSGVAAILESVRAFIASGVRHDNDIIICITDGEEVGLNGAYLFAREHPWAKDVGLVLNFEARGASGPSNMLLEVVEGNSNLISSFNAAKVYSPVANSFMYSIYKLLPNDTDSTVFREELSIPSFFFAFIDNHFVYHTSLDKPQNLYQKSLLHQSSYLSQLLPFFANYDLTTLNSKEDSIFFDFPFIGLISYPFNWSLSFWLITFFVYLIVFYLAYKKSPVFTVKKFLKAIFWNAIFLMLFGVLSFFVWEFICFIHPHYKLILQGFSYNGHFYIFTFASIATLLVFCWIFFLSKTSNVLIHSLAFQFFWLIICFGLATYLTGGSYLVFPLFFSICISVLNFFNFKWKTAIQLLLAFPIIVIIIPFIQFIPVGLGLQYLFVSMLLVVLLCFLLFPLIAQMKHRKVIFAILMLFSLIGFFAAFTTSNFTEDQPRPSSLVYLTNGSQAYYATYESDLSPWNALIVNDLKEVESVSMVDFPSKYQTRFKRFFEAPKHSFEASTYKVDHLDEKTISITLFPAKASHRIELFLNKPTTFSQIIVNGKQFHGNLERNQHLLTYFVVNQEPISILIATEEANKLNNLLLIESSYELINNSILNIPQRPLDEIPMPFVINDALIQTKKIML